MALAPEIDNQAVMALLAGRLRPGADWGSCDPGIPPGEEEPVTAHGMLIATWRDQIQTVPTEQEFEDEYAAYQLELAEATAATEAIATSKAALLEVKEDFDTGAPFVAAFYNDNTNTVGLTRGQILTALTSWNAAPANLAQATVNLNALAAWMGLLTVGMMWVIGEVLALRRNGNGQE